MGTTPRGMPYPELSDTPDVPRDIRALAEAADKLALTVNAIKAAMAPVPPVQWAWGDNRYSWISPTGSWNDPPGGARTIPTQPGAVYDVTSHCMVWHTSFGPMRMSVWADGVFLGEYGGTADTSARTMQAHGVFTAKGPTARIETKFAGVYHVIGNGWSSPETIVTRIEPPPVP